LDLYRHRSLLYLVVMEEPMNRTGHELFQLWARDKRSYVQEFDLGYGGTVTARVLEGQGEILPGAPRCGGRKKTEVDHTAVKIEKFVCGLSGKEKKILKVWYLEDHLSGEEKATRLSMGLRSVYRSIEKLQNLVVQLIYPTDLEGA